MKFFLRIFTLLSIIVIFVGCANKERSPLLYKDKNDAKSISYNDDTNNLDYTIDKITLSKSYQSIEPSIEIIKNGLDASVLVSLGIVESSGINIEKIDKVDRDINIYVHNDNKNTKGDLVVPQILLHFNDLSFKETEGLNFKIISQNYQPLKANIDISEAISKIKSSLKFSTSTFPSANIKKDKDNILLDLNFTNAVDLGDKDSPIVNLDVSIDLNSGEIINSIKNPVSSLIDKGNILDYISNKYILYVKEEGKENNINYDLWIYNIEKDTKEKIASFKNKISSLKFNPNADKAFLIESSEESSNLYILEFKDLQVHKVNLKSELNSCIAVWKDEDIVLVDKKDNDTKIYNLNIEDSTLDLISTTNDDIKQIYYLDKNFLFTVENDGFRDIYISQDFRDNILIDRGEKPLFVDSKTIAYLKNDSSSDKNTLWFYSLEDKSIKTYMDINVQDFFIWENDLAIIEKSQIGSDNPLYFYDFEKQGLKFIASVKNDKIFLNTEKDVLYINSSIDIGEIKTPIISFIDLKDQKTH